MEFDYRHAIIPSGMYVQPSPVPVVHSLQPITFVDAASPRTTLRIELCNPMPVRPVEAIVVQEVRPAFAAEFERTLHRVPIIGTSELYNFAEQLLEIGRILAGRVYDVVIIPLRGGLKPWLQLDVLREFRQQPLWLPYTAGSQRTHDEQITHILHEGLAPHERAARLKIAIVDTAISGDGSYHLAELLSDTHRRNAKQRWECDFHLLHTRERYPAKTGRIPELQHDQLAFSVTLWPVDHLLVEDWNEAIGLEVQWEGNSRAIIKHCSTEGHLLLRREDGSVQHIESPELHHYMDVLLGDAVSEHVRHDPYLQFQGDVWGRYVHR